MDLKAARHLKQEAQEMLIRPLLAGYAGRRLGIRASSIDLERRPPTIALGIAKVAKNQFGLAVRIQNPLLQGGEVVAKLRSLSKDAADVRFIGSVRKQQSPWYEGRCRPLLMGCSLAHNLVTAGTLGCFVRKPGGQGALVLSNNHVLANENQASVGDLVVQPGPYDGGQTNDAVGRLAGFVPLAFGGHNRVDGAVAELDRSALYSANELRGVGTLAGLRPGALDIGDEVGKIGRTTGVTTGVVTAIEVDNVLVGYDHGDAYFDGQIEISATGNSAFSHGGDSGSLIYDADRRAAALLFAGSDAGGSNGLGVTYAHPLREALDLLSVELLA